MNIIYDGSNINVTEKEWATNFPSLCYRDIDGDEKFYESWTTTRGFLFPDKELPENGPVIWSSILNEWIEE